MTPIKPMLAVSGKAFSNADWIFEPKIDGARCIASVSDRTVELQNRRLRPIAYRYPDITKALRQATSDCVLDGELAVFSKGIPDFGSLAVREQQSKAMNIDYLAEAMPANYIVFDILSKGQENLMNLPLAKRKSILKKEVQENDFITLIDYMQSNGEEYFKASLSKGLEGIMAKRLASTYQPGIRSHDWIKIKKHKTLDLVIGGYITGQGYREPFFGSLLLGAYETDKLRFVGRVGSGFSTDELQRISHDFKPSNESPFQNAPAFHDAKWLKPEMVVEIEVMEITKKGHIRAPVFLRMRHDKSPEDCTIDQLKITKQESNHN